MRNETVERRWDAYKFPPSFVLGFHGCDRSIGEAVLRGDIEHLARSENDYDWLGTGIYFWENDPQRALDWATEGFSVRGTVQDPFVVGTIINLGRCLDLRDVTSLLETKTSYEGFALATEEAQRTLPRNIGPGLKLRKLDCAVINFLHERRSLLELPAYNTVRSNFWEGEPL